MNLKNIDSAIEALQLQREIKECKEREAPAAIICYCEVKHDVTACGLLWQPKATSFLAADVTCPECLMVLNKPAEIKHLDYGRYVKGEVGEGARIFLQAPGGKVKAYTICDDRYKLAHFNPNASQRERIASGKKPFYTITGNLGDLVNE